MPTCHWVPVCEAETLQSSGQSRRDTLAQIFERQFITSVTQVSTFARDLRVGGKFSLIPRVIK